MPMRVLSAHVWLDRVRSAGEGQLTLLRWLRHTHQSHLVFDVSRQRPRQHLSTRSQDVTVAPLIKTLRSGMAGLFAENTDPAPCLHQGDLTYDNEERFSLGGAAHWRIRGDSAVAAAPVSEKRVGLNRSPRQDYGR
jgi:hypothetical protein